ncbi:MAG: hypothetical protein K6F70_01445 [Eggerthellaceae bacterium]|nr:hypothetical protein [Eggerthellaceae bacterium]
MSVVKPTMILQFTLDGRVQDDDTTAEMKRTFSYIAPVQVLYAERADDSSGQPATADAPACEPSYENELTCCVIAHVPYWDSADASANEYWNQVMKPWLSHRFAKIVQTLEAQNRVRAERGEPELTYSHVTIDFRDNGSVSVPLSFEDAWRVLESARL